MSEEPICPLPLDFLLSSARPTVQQYELAQLNLANNLSKQVKLILDEIVQLRVQAEVARLVLENWSALHFAGVVAEEDAPAIEEALSGGKISTASLRLLEQQRLRESSLG